MNIGKRKVGDGAPSFIVGEVGQAHDGSYALAHAYIDAIAGAGADAVKFQCHIAEAESTPDEKWRVEPKWRQDENRYAYWRRMEFTPEQWAELAEHAAMKGLAFIVSPFSVKAVRMVAPLVDAWKIASGEVGNLELLAAVRGTGKPMLLSSGMSTIQENHDAYCFLYDVKRGGDVLRLTCVSKYPTPPEDIELPSDDVWWDGISDHSGTIWPAIVYAAGGWGGVIEVHVTLSRGTGLFDESSSITVEELKQLVQGVRFVTRMSHFVCRDDLARELQPMRELFLDRHKRKAACVESA